MKSLAIGPVEGRIIRKACSGGCPHGSHTIVNIALGKEQPLQGDIGAKRGTGIPLENPV